MTTNDYILAATRLDWLLRPLERSLSSLHDGFSIDPAFVRASAGSRLPNHEETTAALNGLAHIGILRLEGTSLRLDKQRLSETEQFRSGVWQTVKTLIPECTPAAKAQLCVALPPGFDTQLATQICREAIDLRAAILEILASAQSEILVASPFWDEETTAELDDLIGKRLDAGVHVTLLGRFNDLNSSSMTLTLRRLSKHPCCHVLSWFRPARPDSDVQTFHFKVAIADRGIKAYLGSANLTAAGLRSRMELGVVLSGETARQLHRIVLAILPLASPF